MTAAGSDTALRPSTLLGSAAGWALAGVINVLRALPRIKPLHPKGRLYAARLVVDVPWPESGVAFLAAAGSGDCTVRVSRALGLPEPWPDVDGLALRLGTGGDLLFASTGLGAWSRRVLLPHRRPGRHPMSTLFPFSCRLGRVDLAVRPQPSRGGGVRRGAASAGGGWQLLTSLDGNDWVSRGVLCLVSEVGTGDALRFHPVGDPPHGLAIGDFWARLRDPAYRLARLRSRKSLQVGSAGGSVARRRPGRRL